MWQCLCCNVVAVWGFRIFHADHIFGAVSVAVCVAVRVVVRVAVFVLQCVLQCVLQGVSSMCAMLIIYSLQ